MLINNPVITGSFTVNGTNFITNTPTTGSNTFNGNQIISGSAIVTGSLQVTGSMTATGTITAQTLVVQTVTSSVVFSSGSNIFGNSLANTQQLTGSVGVTGSFTVATTGTELQVTNTGVTLGNALTDIHNATGSLRITGSLAVGSGSFPQTFAVKISGSTYNGTNVWFQDASPTDGMSFGGNGANSFKTINTYGGALYLNNISQNGVSMFGNVGIGTTSPSSRLYVSTTAGATKAYDDLSKTNIMCFDNTSMAAGVGGSITFGGYKTGTSAGGNFAAIDGVKENGTAGNEAGAFRIWTPNGGGVFTERMRINSSGYVKASNDGTYSSATSTAHEIVQSLSNYQIITNTHTGATPYGVEINFKNADPNNATSWGLGFYTESPSFVWIYRIYSNGTVAARSDARWKKNIETARNGYLEDLCQLRVVKYNWYNHEEDAPKELGLIAQEVEEVFPNLISYDKVTTKRQVEQEDGTFIEQEVEDGESRSIKTSVLPYMLLKAMQEQQAQIEALKTEIEILKNK